MDALQKKLPYSLDAEQSVLGSILIDPECFDDVAQIVRADDFYLETHGFAEPPYEKFYICPACRSSNFGEDERRRRYAK